VKTSSLVVAHVERKEKEIGMKKWEIRKLL